MRWEAELPGALWHGDVCHASPIIVDQDRKPVRIHALLDDSSRYVVAIEAMHQEREIDMLGLLVRAIRKHGPPDALYLDNGSTYRGQTLALACARMGTTLVHAKPYDAPARGKTERFRRTCREACLDFTVALSSLHDINVRLYAFLSCRADGQDTRGCVQRNAAPPDGFDDKQRCADGACSQARSRRLHRPDGWRGLETDLGFLSRSGGRRSGIFSPLRIIQPAATPSRRRVAAEDVEHEVQVAVGPLRRRG